MGKIVKKLTFGAKAIQAHFLFDNLSVEICGWMRSILKPVNPNTSDMIGAAMLKIQNGKYSIVGTPSVPDMNAPHEFHGTSGDVTVPASAHARDRFCGFSPRSSNAVRYSRAGKTSAMYWSAATIFNPIADTTTAAINCPVVFARSRIGLISFASSLNSSSNVPKATAPMMIQTVGNMLRIPPRERRLSTAGMPEFVR